MTTDSPGAAATAGTVTSDGVETGETNPVASVPVAVAESITAPASTSLCLTTEGASAVQVSDAPGASPGAGGIGQVTFPAVESDTATEASGVLPVFVTW